MTNQRRRQAAGGEKHFHASEYVFFEEVKQMPCENTRPCTCRNLKCPNHGRCCACVANHRSRGNLPFCLYTPEQLEELEKNRPPVPPEKPE